VLAAETQGPPPDEAPLNPAFLEIAQGSGLAPSELAPLELAAVEAFSAERGPAGRGLGHLPLIMDLSHLQRLPVQRTTKARRPRPHCPRPGIGAAVPATVP